MKRMSKPAPTAMARRRRAVWYSISFVLFMFVALAVGQAIARAPGKSYESPERIAGLPLVATRLEARGIVAIGGRATGAIAFGGLAVGVIAVGGVAVGGIALRAVSLGILAISGDAVGRWAVGGYAYAEGGLALG